MATTRPGRPKSPPMRGRHAPISLSDLVLVVEDEPAVAELIVRLLASSSIPGEVVPSGEAALDRLASGPPVQIVLLDVTLPGIDGFEVCQRIKADSATRLIPVVMITGRTALKDRLAGIEAGADDFLSKPFQREELLARVRMLLRLKQHTDEMEHIQSVLILLAQSVEARDPCTAGHCERLSRYAVALGRRLGLEDDLLDALRIAGVVHDLGKIATPDAILLKPGRLTPDERRIIEQHPVVGETLCAPIRSFALIRPIIRHHHERMDGSGYPDKLRGDDIPITARVLTVVDVFDALTTARPYRSADTVAGALTTLRTETGRGWYDPGIVEAFCELVMTGQVTVDAKP